MSGVISKIDKLERKQQENTSESIPNKRTEERQINPEEKQNNDSSFTDSAIIGAVTNSGLLGGLLGGDIVGGLVGDLLNGGKLND